jgi:hypothetical protein
MGDLHQAWLGPPRVGKGPALEAEHLGLEQRVRDGRAVDANEGPVAPRPGAVEDRRQQALARPALPLDQDRRKPAPGLVVEEPLDLLANRDGAGALTDKLGRVIHGIDMLRRFASTAQAAVGDADRPSAAAGHQVATTRTPPHPPWQAPATASIRSGTGGAH